MLLAYLLAIIVAGPHGFVNGKHCMGSRFASGDIIPIFIAGSAREHTLTVTTIKALRKSNREIVGYVYEDPNSTWKLLQAESGMSAFDIRLSGYKGALKVPMLQQIPARAYPWRDLTTSICVRALP
jgi:hypothetical protein